jgi:hypothetical protein
MTIKPFGWLKGITRFWYQFTSGEATGLAAQPVILYGTDGNAYDATGGGGGSNIVYGPDAIGEAPAHPPVFIGGEDSDGNIKAIAFNATGEIPVHDATADASLSDIDINLSPASNVALINIGGANADTAILGAATRKAVQITNDQGANTAIMYLSFGANPASLTSYTVMIPPNSYYEVPDKMRNLQMRAIWGAATGAARVTVGS